MPSFSAESHESNFTHFSVLSGFACEYKRSLFDLSGSEEAFGTEESLT